MTHDLLVKARASVSLIKLPSGQLRFLRFTVLSGVRFLDELAEDKDVLHISLDDFARAFHGTATKSTRKRSKSQIRRLIPILIDDGWMVVTDYEGREMSGLTYVRNIPDRDDDDIVGMLRSRIEAAAHQRDIKQSRLEQLKANFQKIIG